MSSENNIKKYFELMKETHCTRTILDNIDDFDFDAFDVVRDIYENGQNFDTQKWRDVYDENKKNAGIYYAILVSPYTPKSLLDTMVHDICDLNFKHIEIFFEEFFSKEISQDCFDFIVNNRGFFFLKNLFKTNYRYLVNYDDNICVTQENLKRLADYMINSSIDDYIEHKDEPEMCLLYNIPSTYFSLLYIEDRDYLLTILNQKYKGYDIPELAASTIVNNPHLDENDPLDRKIIELAFSLSDINKINIFHDCIADDLSFMVHETFLNKCLDVNTGQYIHSDDFYDIKYILEKLADDKKLNSSVERDLANHLIKMKLKSWDPLIETIFGKTSDIEIIKQINDLYRDNKMFAFLKNDNIPENIIFEKAEEYYDKMRIKKSKVPNIPYTWHTNLTNFAKRCCFSDRLYDVLIQPHAFNYRLIKAIVLSNKTPDHIIDKYYDTTRKIANEHLTNADAENKDNESEKILDQIKTHSVRIAMLCNFVKFCRENNISPVYLNLAANIFSCLTLSTDDKNVEQFLNEQFVNTRLTKENLKISELLSYSKENTEKLKEFFEEYLKGEDIYPFEKEISKIYKNIISESIVDYEKTAENKSPTKETKQNELVELLKTMKTIFAHNSTFIYHNLLSTNILKEIDELYAEIESKYSNVLKINQDAEKEENEITEETEDIEI